MSHSTIPASLTVEAGQSPQTELCTGIGDPDQSIHVSTFSSRPCPIHNMNGGGIPLSDPQATVGIGAWASPSSAGPSSAEDLDFESDTGDPLIDIDVCVDCRIRAPTLPPDGTCEYQVYKIAVRAPPGQRGPCHVLFVSHRGDIYGFAGTYIFVDGYLDRYNTYHEHLSNVTPGSANHISSKLIASIPAANMRALKSLCRNLLPPRQQVYNGWGFYPWEPLYRSEDWIDDIIIMGGQIGLLAPCSSYLLEMISEDEGEKKKKQQEEMEMDEEMDEGEPLVFHCTL